MQGYCLNCSNISKYVRGEFHGKIVKTVGIFFGQSNFLTITPSEWRLGKKFKHFFFNLLPLLCIASRKGRSLHINVSNIIRGKSDLFVQEEEITLRTQSLSRVMFGT